MSSQPGSLYRIGTRRYVDSQAIYNLAGAHDVVQLPSGWRVLDSRRLSPLRGGRGSGRHCPASAARSTSSPPKAT
jgi:hypothetical protein